MGYTPAFRKEKNTRVNAALQFVQFVEDDGDTFFDRIVTRDTIWTYH